jgi:hypothetical protein
MSCGYKFHKFANALPNLVRKWLKLSEWLLHNANTIASVPVYSNSTGTGKEFAKKIIFKLFI